MNLKSSKNGYFGKYGGQFVPETLMAGLEGFLCFLTKISKNKKDQAQL